MRKRKFYCNACGRELAAKKGILHEDALAVCKDWGYFSKKDLEIHTFMLCEQCYDKMISGFRIPVVRTLKTEAM